jgi:hypothetical protein
MYFQWVNLIKNKIISPVKSGTAAGSCASSFGVCCTFSIACGSSSSVSKIPFVEK